MKYEGYKPTGIFWLPHIPDGWDCLLLSQTAKEQCEKKPTGEIYTVMSLSYGNVIRKKNIDAGLVPANYDNYQVIRAGNIILRLTDLQNDHTSLRTGLVKETGIITSAYTCLAPGENPAYLQYLLHSYDTRKVFYGMGGGVRQSIGYKDIRNMKVPVPPRAEQDQIVRYLDWQVSKINTLIAAKKREIGLLKEHAEGRLQDICFHGIGHRTLVESGIEWIGAIPKDWKTIRCKNCFSERDERSVDGCEEHLSMSQKYGLVPDSMLDERRMLSESYAGGKVCYRNDLVLNRLKAHLGVFALASQKGVISPDYTVLMPNTEKILPEYGMLVLKSSRCRRELRVRVRGVVEGFWRLYTDDFGTIIIPWPSTEEQEKIITQAVQIREDLQKTISTIERQIDCLHECRTRLISDVVTGQIDVRGIEIPDFEMVEEITSDKGEPDEDEALVAEEQEE